MYVQHIQLVKHPIVGRKLTPFIVLCLSDGSQTNEDVPESAPIDGHFLRYTWYRIERNNTVTVCSIHPTQRATLQCLGCVKAKIPVAKSYHCSSKCFYNTWQHHRILHEQAAHDKKDDFSGAGVSSGSLVGPVFSFMGETLFEVGRSKTYIPTPEDIGHVLRLECVVVHSEMKLPIGQVSRRQTHQVIPASPSPRRWIPVNGVDLTGKLYPESYFSAGKFTILSYNILPQMHAKRDRYGYCPSWALAWPFRKQNLLREIISYHADIVCLQEVQSDQFDKFFAPELEKHGYKALYKTRTNEFYNRNENAMDGCATFFRRDRFSHVTDYKVEFNRCAKVLTDATPPGVQKERALHQLTKDNVALIVVLEANFVGDIPMRQRLLSVANTLMVNPWILKDVIPWQVHHLLEHLERLAASANIPMLVCGGFNFLPGSAPHSLIVMGKVDLSHPNLKDKHFWIWHPPERLNHGLPLVSAYSSFVRMKDEDPGAKVHKRRMDTSTNEPLFTYCTGDFTSTPDYIFYTANSLTVEGLLELLDEQSLRKYTALPSPEWSSARIALGAELSCKSWRN